MNQAKSDLNPVIGERNHSDKDNKESTLMKIRKFISMSIAVITLISVFIAFGWRAAAVMVTTEQLEKNLAKSESDTKEQLKKVESSLAKSDADLKETVNEKFRNYEYEKIKIEHIETFLEYTSKYKRGVSK